MANNEAPSPEGPGDSDPFDDEFRGCEAFEDLDFSPDRYGDADLEGFPTIEELEALEEQIAELVQRAAGELPEGDEPAWKVVHHLGYAGEDVRRARRARRIGKEDGVV